eukprot:331963_1
MSWDDQLNTNISQPSSPISDPENVPSLGFKQSMNTNKTYIRRSSRRRSMSVGDIGDVGTILRDYSVAIAESKRSSTNTTQSRLSTISQSHSSRESASLVTNNSIPLPLKSKLTATSSSRNSFEPTSFTPVGDSNNNNNKKQKNK